MRTRLTYSMGRSGGTSIAEAASRWGGVGDWTWLYPDCLKLKYNKGELLLRSSHPRLLHIYLLRME